MWPPAGAPSTPPQSSRGRRPRDLQQPLKEIAMALNLKPNLSEAGKRYFSAYSPGDDFYEAADRRPPRPVRRAIRMLNARLILLLANHIGDIACCAKR
jgi:hypothetical protein